MRTKKEDYVKRIIGLPGDHIEYKHDKLYINGQFVDEPYLEKYKKEINGRQLTGDFTLEELTKEKTVPPGYIFVVGDNRLGSWDSRHFGFVKADTVVGKVDLRYWPIQEVQTNFFKKVDIIGRSIEKDKLLRLSFFVSYNTIIVAN